MLVSLRSPFRQYLPNCSGNDADRAYRDLPFGFDVELPDEEAAALIAEKRAVAVVTEVAPIPDTDDNTPEE